jgi:uncharacterized protein YheU (UPF0270 family)
MARHCDTSVQGSESDEAGSLDESSQPVIVPHTELSADALHSLIESFVLREGTEYGEREVLLEQKVAQVMRQLERGEARIVFDPTSESIDIVLALARTSKSTRN